VRASREVLRRSTERAGERTGERTAERTDDERDAARAEGETSTRGGGRAGASAESTQPGGGAEETARGSGARTGASTGGDRHVDGTAPGDRATADVARAGRGSSSERATDVEGAAHAAKGGKPSPSPTSLGDFLARTGEVRRRPGVAAGPARDGARPATESEAGAGRAATGGEGERAGERGGAAPWGDAHDDHLLGAASTLEAARHRRVKVTGRGGRAGPTRADTILRSSVRGFSDQAYRRVFTDYTSVADEFMARDEVPPGYRFFVERYFRLIRPRR
jgi:hypothetical protein